MSEQLEFLSECEIGAGEVAARLRIVFPQLSTSDRRIADVLLTQPAVVVRSSVSEVAELVGVSAATVVRACLRFGFEGFQDVKISIAQDLVRTGRLRRRAPLAFWMSRPPRVKSFGESWVRVRKGWPMLR